MPLFSVIIPTRNRAHLLRYAMQSILAQDFKDYEIIVSDNHSQDDTQQVIDSFATKAVRYFKPDTYLRMHDHWEFARKQARGEFLLFLGDDDCLLGDALRTLANVIRSTNATIVGCKNIDYYSPDYWVKTQRNHMLILPFSGEIIEINTREALEQCFRFNPQYFPRVTVPIARTLVESISDRVGRFFDYPYAEYVGFAMAFAMIERYPFIDRPLVVLGRTPDSFGPRYFWSTQDTSWQETTGKPFTFVPLKGTYFTNGVAESLLRAKNYLPEKFEGINLSVTDYLKCYYADMLTQSQLGRNISSDLADFREHVKTLDQVTRRQVESMIEGTPIDKSLRLKVFLKSRSVLNKAQKLLWRFGETDHGRADGGRWIDGRNIGVSDILSCVEWLNAQDIRVLGN